MNFKNLPSAFAIDLAKSTKLLDNNFRGYIQNPYGTGAYMYWMTSTGQQVCQTEIYDLKDKVSEEDKARYMECEEQAARLEMFQKIALLRPYSVAVKVYTGVELTQEQVSSLELIAELTPAWVKGELADHLLKIATHDSTEQKSIANIAQALLDTLDDDGGIGGGSEAGGKKAKAVTRQFYMELTSND